MWSTSGDGDKRMWRRKSFEREKVSPGMRFGRAFWITFVSGVNRNSLNYPTSSSPTRRPQRKAMQDLEDSQQNNLDIKRQKAVQDPEDSERDNLNTKRRKVDDNASYNYIL
jgi:hypothetical protein